MRTAEQIVEERFTQHKADTVGRHRRDIIEAMQEYARQVAAEVRAECTNKAEWKSVPPRMTNMDGIEVDRQSILNVDIEQFIQ